MTNGGHRVKSLLRGTRTHTEKGLIVVSGQPATVLRHRRILKLAFAIPATGLMVVVASLSGILQSEESRLAMFCVAIIGVMGLGTWAARTEKKIDFFEPPVVIFALFVLFYPLRLIFAFLLDEPLLNTLVSALRLAIWACLAGFLAFLAGYRSKIAIRIAQRAERLVCRLDGEWDVWRTNLLGIAFLVICLGTLCAVYLTEGSVFYFMSLDPVAKNPYDIAPWYYYATWGMNCLLVGALFQLVVSLRYRRQHMYTVAYLLGAAVVAGLVSRGTLVALLLLALGLVNYLYKKVGPTLMVWVGSAAATWLVLGGILRMRVSSMDVPVGGTLLDYLSAYVLGGLDHLYVMALLMQSVPGALPLQYGSTFLPLLLKPIPRTLMPNKPLGAGGILNSILFPVSYDAGYATTPTMLGEWYMNFSWVGIILGMALVGIAAAILYRLLGRGRSPARVVLYMVCLLGLIAWVRGDLNVASTGFLFYFLPTLVGLFLVRRRGPIAAPPR